MESCPSNCFANPPASYRSLSGPPGTKSQKSLKRVSRGTRPRGPKKSRKSPEQTFSRLFPDFRDFFETFSRLLWPRGRRPHETLAFQRRARETPVARGRVRNNCWFRAPAEAGTEKVPQINFCNKDFAELSGELSGAICLKTLVLLGSALELLRNSLVLFLRFFWLWGSVLALDRSSSLIFYWFFCREVWRDFSRGVSGVAFRGCLQGGASFEVEKAHFTAQKKGPENRKHEVNLRPPLCRPLKHSMIQSTGSKFGGKYRSAFCEKCRSSKQIFRARTSFCRRATLVITNCFFQELRWVGTASGPFLENNFHPPWTGWKVGFRDNPETGLKWVKSGFRPTFDLFLYPKNHFGTHFSPSTKTYLKPTLSANKLFSKKGPWGSPDPA